MKKILLIITIIALTFSLCACAKAEVPEGNNSQTSGIKWSELTFSKEMKLDYAKQFSVKYSDDGNYKLITIGDDQKILLVGEGKDVPSETEKDLVILKQPLDKIYLVATAAMDYFRQLDAIDNITLCSQKSGSWVHPEANAAMDAGKMVYAGKYSTPDYELILSKGCNLAIENTMIYHSPDVKEQLEKTGIPVIVENSGYESEPLARMEWIKLYAALLDKEDEAEKFFESNMAKVNEAIKDSSTGKTVAFFSIASNGTVSVRKSGDYVAKCIDLAGAKYISYDEDSEENALSTMNISLETFYAAAKDADMIIYNSTIEGEIGTIEQLLDKCHVLSDFKAVKNGNAWCIEKNFYQSPLELGEMIVDVHTVLSSENADDSQLYFLHKLI